MRKSAKSFSTARRIVFINIPEQPSTIYYPKSGQHSSLAKSYKYQSCYNIVEKPEQFRDEYDRDLLDQFCSQYFSGYSLSKLRLLTESLFCETFSEGKESKAY